VVVYSLSLGTKTTGLLTIGEKNNFDAVRTIIEHDLLALGLMGKISTLMHYNCTMQGGKA